MVDPEWQRAGLATRLHERMVEYARERNVRGFKADVLTDNAAMLHVLQHGDHNTSIKTSDGIQNARRPSSSE